MAQAYEPGRKFNVHLDLSLSGDSTGVCVGHFGGLRHVGKSLNWDEDSKKYLEDEGGERPVAVIDGVLEILPPRGDEIDLNIVGDFLEMLNSRILIWAVTADSFQSVALLQRMRRLKNKAGRRVNTAILSVDTSLAPYAEVKQGLRDERLILPKVDKLKTELLELVLDPKTLRVDHPPKGSKDLSDAVAGVTYVIMGKNAPRGLKGSLGRKLLEGLSADAGDQADERQYIRPRGSGRSMY